jgi:hypothetical protein
VNSGVVSQFGRMATRNIPANLFYGIDVHSTQLMVTLNP